MTATPSAPPLPHVVAELDGRAAVVWATDPERGERNFGVVRAGGFLPRNTYPIAVMDADGNITRITRDPLPKAQLASYLTVLQRPATVPTTEAVNAGPGDLVAIDSSGSTDPAFVGQWAEYFTALGAEVVLFDQQVHRYTGDIVGGGNTDPRALVAYVDNHPVPPRRVFVLTDGWMPPATPADPARWTWALPVDGKDWMTEAGAGQVVYTH